ncbi:hypothetical protein [Micromonospora psammae]|uniref:hypothetical protein n=1 Tax=Micromonospora sp. CPCC 205556 TaxID=3122398 RepID=UPI002FF08194
MAARAEQGMSAPPEVVFSTATDPARVSAWLPAPLRHDGDKPAEADAEQLRARWDSGSGDGWSAELWVEPADSGGSLARLELTGDAADGLADESLANLAREVADNLTAG